MASLKFLWVAAIILTSRPFSIFHLPTTLSAAEFTAFAGITDVTEIRFQPTILTATPDEDRAAATARASDAGKAF